MSDCSIILVQVCVGVIKNMLMCGIKIIIGREFRHDGYNKDNKFIKKL